MFMAINSIKILREKSIEKTKAKPGYRFICLVVIMLLFSSGFALAGEKGYMVVKDNETILDQKAGASITWQNKIWFTQSKVRIENTQEKHNVLLIHMTGGKIYQLNTQDKTYRLIDFPEGLKDLYGKGEIKSQKMDQTKKFGEWECYGIKLSTTNKDLSIDTEYWITKDVDIPIELRKKIAKYFGPDQIRLTEELAQYEGYPVHTILTMKVSDKEIKMISNVVEVKKLEINPEIFEIPADFKLMTEMMRKGPEQAENKDPNTKDPKQKNDFQPKDLPE
jgi:hypothetical protein